MRIRSQLIAAITVSTILSIAMAVSIFARFSSEQTVLEVQNRAQTASREAAGLIVLTQEFAVNGDERVSQQWWKRHLKINDAVRRLSVPERYASTAPAEIRENLEKLSTLFAALEKIAAAPSNRLSQQRTQIIADQLVTNTQAMSEDAYRWADEVYSAHRSMTQQFLKIFTFITIGFACVISGIAFVIIRRVLRPLQQVQNSAVAVQRGDLTVRNNNIEQDELGELAREFDEMTDALQQRSAAVADATRLLQSEIALRSTQEKLTRLITDNLPILIAYVDSKGQYQFANKQYDNLFGLDHKRMVGKDARDVIDRSRYGAVKTQAMQALRGNRVVFEHQVTIGLAAHDLKATYIPDVREDGSVAGFIAMNEDVTERRLAEQKRLASEKRLRTITDNLPVLITYIDRERRLRFANATINSWMGLSPEQANGRHFQEIVGDEIYAARREQIDRVLAGERVEFENTSAMNGATRHMQSIYIPDQAADGSTRGFYTLTTDVTRMKESEQKLSRLARVDTLTGLPNRLQFNEKLTDALARSKRSKEKVGLMYLDIDHFKQINDTYGHRAGDDVLVEFARRLAGCVRSTDTVARLAGDEFVIVLEGLHDATEPGLIASKIIDALVEPFVVNTHRLRCSSSIGIAFADIDELAPDTLLAMADKALYEAKNAGRNTFRLAKVV